MPVSSKGYVPTAKIVESIAVRDFFESFGEQLQLRLVTSGGTLDRSTVRERSVNRPA